MGRLTNSDFGVVQEASPRIDDQTSCADLAAASNEVVAERKPLVREKRAAGRDKRPICEVEP